METTTETKYSFKKGLLKGAIGALSFIAGIVALTAFSDVPLWGLLETYIKPLIGSVTVSGVLVMAINALKFHYQK